MWEWSLVGKFNFHLHFDYGCAILTIVANKRACSSAGRAFGSHPRGQGFESLQVHQLKASTQRCV